MVLDRFLELLVREAENAGSNKSVLTESDRDFTLLGEALDIFVAPLLRVGGPGHEPVVLDAPDKVYICASLSLFANNGDFCAEMED